LPEEVKNLKMSVLIDTAAENQQKTAGKTEGEGIVSKTVRSISSWNRNLQQRFCHAAQRRVFVPFQSQISALPSALKKS